LVERLGAETLVYINYKNEYQLAARIDSLAAVEVGQNIEFTINFDSVHSFDELGARISPNVTDALIDNI